MPDVVVWGEKWEKSAMNDPRIGVVVNPRARACRDDPNLEAKLRYTLGEVGPLVIAWEQGFLETTLKAWAERGIDLVAIVGGDGTNLYSLTAIIRAYGESHLPRVAFLGGGTNNVARSALGFRRRPIIGLLERLVGSARAGLPIATVPCDVMRVNDLYAFFFGAGFVARFYELYYQSGTPSRLRTAQLGLSMVGAVALGLPRARRFFEPVAASIRLDAEEFPGPHRIILAAKMDKLPVGLRPTYRAREQLGRFQVILSNEPTATYATQFWRIFQGRPFDGPTHVDRLATRLDVHFESESPYMVDGELFRGSDVSVSSGPVLPIVTLE